MESGTHSSLHLNCHQQITHAKFNLKTYYPPPYEREIWHYEKANVDHIRRSIDEFSWERCFANSSVNTVKPVLTTTFIKRPPILNDHIAVLPYDFWSNFSLYSDHLYNVTNDHLNDISGFLSPAYNDHCTVFIQEVIIN